MLTKIERKNYVIGLILDDVNTRAKQKAFASKEERSKFIKNRAAQYKTMDNKAIIFASETRLRNTDFKRG